MDNQITPRPPSSRKSSPARRKKKRDDQVARLVRRVRKFSPALDDPRYGPLLASFARISLLALDSYEFLRTNGIGGENGEIRSSVETVNRLIGGQLKLATALGLTPASLAKVRNEKPADLAALLADHAVDAEVVADAKPE